MSAVVLDRPGLVHEVCSCCGGDGKSEAWFSDACRVTRCGYCAGRGYVVTEAPELESDGSDDGLCTRFYPSVEGEAE